MYNDLYLYNLETNIFIESIDLMFDNIDMNDNLSLLLEDGNNDNSNILLKMADSIIAKIKEIIDWIKDKIIGSKEEKDYKAVIDAYMKSNKDFTLTFDDDPEINYNNYVKIYNMIKSGNNNEDIDKIINSEIKKGDKSYKKCQELIDKFNILLSKYNELAKSLKKDIKSDKESNKTKSDNIKRCLKITNLIRKNITILTYSNIIKQPGIMGKIKFWLKNDKTIPKVILATAITIGIIKGKDIKHYVTREINIAKATNFIKKQDEFKGNTIYIDRINSSNKGGMGGLTIRKSYDGKLRSYGDGKDVKISVTDNRKFNPKKDVEYD